MAKHPKPLSTGGFYHSAGSACISKTTLSVNLQVKTRYDMILSDMSEAKHARQGSSKWVRGFFDTKVSGLPCLFS